MHTDTATQGLIYLGLVLLFITTIFFPTHIHFSIFYPTQSLPPSPNSRSSRCLQPRAKLNCLLAPKGSSHNARGSSESSSQTSTVCIVSLFKPRLCITEAILKKMEGRCNSLVQRQHTMTDPSWENTIQIPHTEDGALKLFEAIPQMHHLVRELVANKSSTIFLNGKTLGLDSKMSISSFFPTLWLEGNCHTPLQAFPQDVLVDAKGLFECKPCNLDINTFPEFSFAPEVAFNKNVQVSLSNNGLILPPRMSSLVLGTLITVLKGQQCFVSWPPMACNWEVMKTLKGQYVPGDCLDMFDRLEWPQFIYCKAGSTIYMPACHIWFELAPYAVGQYTITLANPAVIEWENIKQLHWLWVEGIWKGEQKRCMNSLILFKRVMSCDSKCS